MKYVFSILALLFSLRLQAQEFRQDVSITQQLKEGTAPGLKFAPQTNAVTSKQVSEEEKTGYKIVHNKQEGVRYKQAASATGEKPAARQPATGNQVLASDLPIAKEKQAPVKMIPIPSQDNTVTHEITSGQ